MARPGTERITTAEPADRTELEALMRRSSEVWPAYREQLAAHPEVIVVPDESLRAGHVRAAYDEEGYLVGFSAVVPHDHDDGWSLDGLFVDPLSLGIGIGRALLEDVIDGLAPTAAPYLSVVSGPESQGFYETVGFTVVEPAPTRFGPATLLRLEL
jgi:GNAT superfamily N-acetyltransferase